MEIEEAMKILEHFDLGEDLTELGATEFLMVSKSIEELEIQLAVSGVGIVQQVGLEAIDLFPVLLTLLQTERKALAILREKRVEA